MSGHVGFVHTFSGRDFLEALGQHLVLSREALAMALLQPGQVHLLPFERWQLAQVGHRHQRPGGVPLDQRQQEVAMRSNRRTVST